MASFRSNPYLTNEEKHRLADLLNISEVKVDCWFARRRVQEGKSRKIKHMTKNQIKILMENFKDNPFLNPATRTQLAITLNITESSINQWFCIARRKPRVMSLLQSMTEGQQQTLLNSYQTNRLLSDTEKSRLAKLLKTTKKAIEYWFIKTRKEEKEKLMQFQRESKQL